MLEEAFARSSCSAEHRAVGLAPWRLPYSVDPTSGNPGRVNFDQPYSVPMNPALAVAALRKALALPSPNGQCAVVLATRLPAAATKEQSDLPNERLPTIKFFCLEAREFCLNGHAPPREGHVAECFRFSQDTLGIESAVHLIPPRFRAAAAIRLLVPR
uniref:Uncharacterized protein n=1 Tax=Trichuris muris TaxID=70415 RepID=A0A5S6QZ16_TRIMR